MLIFGVFLGQAINPIPKVMEDLMFNKYFQFIIIFLIAFDIYDFRKKNIFKASLISISILFVFEYIRQLQ